MLPWSQKDTGKLVQVRGLSGSDLEMAYIFIVTNTIILEYWRLTTCCAVSAGEGITMVWDFDNNLPLDVA
jgi:hypothetical protein